MSNHHPLHHFPLPFYHHPVFRGSLPSSFSAVIFPLSFSGTVSVIVFIIIFPLKFSATNYHSRLGDIIIVSIAIQATSKIELNKKFGIKNATKISNKNSVVVLRH